MRIGDVTVHALPDGVMPMPPSVLYPDVPTSTWRKLPGTIDQDGLLQVPFGGFLATDDHGHRVVFDLGGGLAPQLLPGGELPAVRELLPAALEKLGCAPDSITDVVFSHLHVDHVGWNTTLKNNKWVATFPKAKYLIGGTEWDFFSHTEDPFLKDPVDDSVRPVMAEGMTELVDAKYKVTDEVWLESTPGHTPGHFAVRISSKGQDAVITGDLMHHPIQCRYPEWDDNFDVDGPQAKKTRREFCERYADGKTLVLGTHFATPSAGKIIKKDDSFRFVPA